MASVLCPRISAISISEAPDMARWLATVCRRSWNRKVPASPARSSATCQAYVRNLSYGEQRQLEIALALVDSPRRLLLDEPTEGLAPLLVREVQRAVADLKAQGLSILLVEQHVSLALQVAEYVHVLSRGRIVHSSAPEALWHNQEVQARYLGM